MQSKKRRTKKHMKVRNVMQTMLLWQDTSLPVQGIVPSRGGAVPLWPDTAGCSCAARESRRPLHRGRIRKLRLAACFLLILLPTLLLASGCDRAGDVRQNQDPLCGVYVNLASWEETEKDEAAVNAHGEKYGWDEDWYPKHYASVTEKEGEKVYSFEDLRGVGMFVTYEADTVEAVTAQGGSRALADLNLSVNSDEPTGTLENQIAGTVLLGTAAKDRIVQINEIRKDEKGYYTCLRAMERIGINRGETGELCSLQGTETRTEDPAGIRNLSQETAAEGNPDTADQNNLDAEPEAEGTKPPEKFILSWEIAIRTVESPEQVIVKQVDRRDQIIRETAFTEKDGDAAVQVRDNTDYIIVEERFKGSGSRKADSTEQRRKTAEYKIHTAYDRNLLEDAEDSDTPWPQHACNYAGEGGLIDRATLTFEE